MENKNLEWKFFPPSPPTKQVGMNNAGIANFSSKRDTSLFRECIQNSLDADDEEKAVVVDITLEHIPVEDIGGRSLREHLESCSKARMSSQDQKEQLEEAFRMLDKETVQTLCIKDHETKGAMDGNSPETPWKSLTDGEGYSPKGEADLGSYGIGKLAPFATTPLRTVLYSTCYKDEKGILGRRFIGRSILCTHNKLNNSDNSDNLESDYGPDGYFGDGSKPLSDDDIPPRFKLENCGTQVYIPAYTTDTYTIGAKNDESTPWHIKAFNSAVDNFFYAIIKNRLELKIAEESNVNSKSIQKGGKYWDRIRKDSKTCRYIEAASEDPVAEKYIKGIGDISLYLKTYENTAERKGRELALVRYPGLMITDKRGSLGEAKPDIPTFWTPFTAVVVCSPKKHSNDWVLRKCEPPSHDELSIDHIPQTNKELRLEAIGALKELGAWLKEEIGKYANKGSSEIRSVATELEDFELVVETGDGDNGKSNNKEKMTMSPLKVVDRAPRTARIRQNGNDQVEISDEEGEEDITNEGGDGSGGDRPGNKTAEGGITKKKAKSPNFTPLIQKSGEHSLILSIALPQEILKEKATVKFGVASSGEDESGALMGLKSAKLNGANLEVDRGAISIEPASFPEFGELLTIHLESNEAIGLASFNFLRIFEKDSDKE